jgi:group I intron endonuclease
LNCGIYCIRNLINNKIYIGSSNNLKRREKNHFSLLTNNSHHSSKLQNSFNKYGVENFKFEIIEYCEQSTRLAREDYYLFWFKPELNIALTTEGVMTNRGHSEKTKAKLKNQKLGTTLPETHKQKISQSMRGKKKTPEHIEKVAAKNRGKKLGPQSYESRSKKMKDFILIDIHTKEATIVKGIREASRIYSLPKQYIQNSIKYGYIINNKYKAINIEQFDSSRPIEQYIYNFKYNNKCYFNLIEISEDIKKSKATISRMLNKGLIMEIKHGV